MSEVIIKFSGVDTRQSNVFAQSLRDAIRSEAPGAHVNQRRDNKENQDFGATLGILLAGPAVVAIAKGVEQWLTRHHGVNLEITTPDGKVIAQNVTAKNAVQIISAARSKA
jgi:hypothetical protein